MYMKQTAPWILLFVVINFSILSIGVIDADIPNLPLLYICIVNTVTLSFFLIWDYFRGKTYREEFMRIEKIEEIDSLPVPVTPYQKRVDEQLSVMRNDHNAVLESESKKTEENLNELTKWIHDMKMPMTTMKLMIDDLDKKQSEMIEKEWIRLDSMLNAMLFEKRLTNISNDLYVETIEIEEVISNVIKRMRTICMVKGIGFDIDLHVTRVETDLKWFSFILDQIISNSIKYSKDNEVTLSSYLNRGWVELEISDAGRGIRAEDIPRVFESGFTSTSDHGEGEATGMGLYLSKQAADALDISISVKSVYGEGTTVLLTFPKKNTLQEVKTM